MAAARRPPAAARRLLLGAGLSALLCASAGCAFAPGLSLGESLKRAPTPGEGAPGAVPGALTPISAELIRQQRAARVPGLPADVQALLGTAGPYRIAPLDVLSIVVWGRPEFSPGGAGPGAGAEGARGGAGAGAAPAASGFLVEPDGRVQLPLLGPVRLAGLTADEAREQLQPQLARYFRNAMLTVRVQAYRGQRLYVSGEVAHKGLLPIDDVPMTLAEALARAGGLTPLGDASAVAVRRDGRTTVVDLARLAAAGLSPADVLLKSGDLVHVGSREDAKVFVLGEVPRAGSQFLRNGRLTLNEALGDAGGVNPGSGDPRQVYVIRHGAGERVDVFHLDAGSAWSYALAEGFELQPRDVVFVDPVPLVNWNRVISLVLPSAQAVTVTRAATGVVR